MGFEEHSKQSGFVKFFRILIASLALIIASGLCAFIVYYFHLVDFLTPLVGGIIRVMAGILYLFVIFFYCRYVQSVTAEGNEEITAAHAAERRERPSKKELRAIKRAEKKSAKAATSDEARLEQNGGYDEFDSDQKRETEAENTAVLSKKERKKLEKEAKKAQKALEKERKIAEKTKKSAESEQEILIQRALDEQKERDALAEKEQKRLEREQRKLEKRAKKQPAEPPVSDEEQPPEPSVLDDTPQRESEPPKEQPTAGESQTPFDFEINIDSYDI